MPKLVGDIHKKTIAETKILLETQGFEGLAMRDIAKRCGVAVGTLYNYFPSKEYLTGCVVLEDWEGVYDQMRSAAATADGIGRGLEAIYELMCRFITEHRYLASFDRRAATGKFAFAQRHQILLDQIVVLLEMLQKRFGCNSNRSLTVFLAESILNFSVKGYTYSQVAPGFMKLLN